MTSPLPGGRRGRGRRRPDRIAIACAAGLAALAGSGVAAPVAEGAPTIIGVIAPRGSRLADDLRREIEASRFVVVAIEARAPDWQADVRLLPGPPLLHGVVVRADDQVMTIFTRTSPSGAITVHVEQTLVADDRLTRRRACLSIVEYLRVLAEGDPPPPLDLGAPSAGAHPASPPVAAAPPASRAGARSDPTQTTATAAPAPETAAIARMRGSLGVGTTLDFDSAPGGPMGHLLFLWLVPIESRVALCVRATWPLLGVQLTNADGHIRSWTTGASVGLRYQLREGPVRVRPFVGAALGSRVALTETTSQDSSDSGTRLTPSLNIGVEAGTLVALAHGVQIFFSVEGARDWMVPGIKRRGQEVEFANAESFQAGAGALFEF